MSAAHTWRKQLAAWAIPDEIVAAAPEPPWGFSTELFKRRADGAIASAPTPTTMRALDVLPEGGTVLDIGVGGGATSLPLAERAGTIVGLDGQADMLDVFRSGAEAAGVAVQTVLGTWPDAAEQAEVADVVMAGHVAYNVAALGPFVIALDDHARLRVVMELTAEHPLTWMRDLWIRFHGLDRPSGPTAKDAEAVLTELGLAMHRDTRPGTGARGGGFERREDAVALVRRRLCLPADRDDEIAIALGHRLRQDDGLWSAGPGDDNIVTLWWDRVV